MSVGGLLWWYLLAAAAAVRGASDAQLAEAFAADPAGQLVWQVPPERTVRLCDDAVDGSADPAAVSALRFVQARALCWSGDRDGALAALEKAVRADPTNVRARLFRANVALYLRRDPSAAGELFAERPADARAVAVWARCCPVDAEALAAKAVTLAGADPEALAFAAEVRGHCHLSRGRYREAAADFSRVLDGAAEAGWLVDARQARRYRGLARLELGEFDGGFADVIRSGGWSADDPRVPRGFWLACLRAGREADALAMADSYRAALPGDGFGVVMRAAALNRLGRPDDALQSLAGAPDDADVLAERAFARHLKGERKTAAALLAAAARKDHNHAVASAGLLAAWAADPTADRAKVRAASGDDAGPAPWLIQVAATDAPEPADWTFRRPHDPSPRPGVTVAQMLAQAAARDYAKAAAAATAALCNPRVGPAGRDALLKALAAYKKGEPFDPPPGLLAVVYEPVVPAR